MPVDVDVDKRAMLADHDDEHAVSWSRGPEPGTPRHFFPAGICSFAGNRELPTAIPFLTKDL